MCDDKAVAVEIQGLRKAVEKNADGIEQNNRALRGSNGNPGLAADVLSLKADMKTLKENDLPHMKNDILKEIKVLQEKALLWPVLGKVGGNIITAIITALAVTALHAWLFP